MAEPQQLVDAGVSAREAEVLRALGEHLTNAEIAARLYISVRTVESHVSSLLRKLGVTDRRALAQLAAEIAAQAGGSDSGTGPGAAPVSAVSQTEAATGATAPAPPPMPSPLTPFVGRSAERAALAAELRQHRLVTAVGPGGVGKTRLALAVAADLVDEYPDGVWYVDLVPVTDPAMIAPAVAAAMGLGEIPDQTAEETVMAALFCDVVLVLDNCEHLVDGAGAFIERLLGRCPRLRVLATSRARLLVPYERVFPVPGLSVAEDEVDEADAADADVAAAGDAVQLFLVRAEAVGSPITSSSDLRRVAAICRALDGMALAIELAAARLPSLGLEGLEAGLRDRLRLLAGGSRLDDRHSSQRATLDWSYELADPMDQTVLRRVSVFAAPFSAPAAGEVVGFAPLADGEPVEIADALGRLADQSLVVAIPGRDGIRYRVLETVRQYGAARLDEVGESDRVAERHLRWSLALAAELATDDHREGLPDTFAETYRGWRVSFDAAADDLRAALGWAQDRSELRSEAHTLASRLGNLLFRRGLTGESQRRYEQAAGLADGDDRTGVLAHAAGVAWTRQAGDDALRLYQEAADSARHAGDQPGVARNLALAATLLNRSPGLLSSYAPIDAEELLTQARACVAGDPAVAAAVLVAEAFAHGASHPDSDEPARRAVAASRELGDPLLESAALDQLTTTQLVNGQLHEAAASASRRVELVAPLPQHADMGFELVDAYHMAVETQVGISDLAGARRYARRQLQHPAYGEGHLGALRLRVADALAGDWSPVLAAAARFRANWERQGRPMISTLGMGCGAAALVHGLRGEQAAQDEWREIARGFMDVIHGSCGPDSPWMPLFDSMVLLHGGRLDEALALMEPDPDADLNQWYSAIWRHWYAPLWAEVAVLARHRDAAERLERARAIVTGNPMATALVDRAVASAEGDHERLASVADTLGRAGYSYQQARTLVLAGGAEAETGTAMLTEMGASPMVKLT